MCFLCEPVKATYLGSHKRCEDCKWSLGGVMIAFPELEVEELCERCKEMTDPVETAIDGWCGKCKVRMYVSLPEEVTLASGKPAVVGRCPLCNHMIYNVGARLSA